MSNTFLLNFAFPVIFLLMAAFFIFVALKTLVCRRPIIISARWLFGFTCVAFLPMIANSVNMAIDSKTVGMIEWVNPVMFTVLLGFFWIQMKGYIAFAISDTYFRDALLSSAKSLEFTIEETMSRLTIKESGDQMQVAIQGWIGTAQLKPAGKGSAKSVQKISNGMAAYFNDTAGKMNYLTSYFYLIMGGFMVLMAILLFTLSVK